jgi:hypothetical protein
MKKFIYYTMMLMLAGFTMTSCETDEEIARRLTDVDWEGNLDTYYTNRWGESFRDGEYRTVWRFVADYYDRYGNATHGYGYEADYDYYSRVHCAYSPFHWEVRNGNIYIYYDDPTWNSVRIDWSDYSLTYNHFHGTMYDWENRVYDFNLYSITSWRWDDWNDYYYRYRTRSADAASGADCEDVYVGENGSFATGKFAEALKRIRELKN